jgi:hypothetical protein
MWGSALDHPIFSFNAMHIYLPIITLVLGYGMKTNATSESLSRLCQFQSSPTAKYEGIDITEILRVYDSTSHMAIWLNGKLDLFTSSSTSCFTCRSDYTPCTFTLLFCGEILKCSNILGNFGSSDFMYAL